jgi:zinc protease
VLSWKVPGFKAFDNEPSTQDALALTMLSAVLDGYAGARLDRALAQGDDRIADSVGASNGLTGRGPQTFSLEGIPAKGKTTEQLEAALRAQVARIAKEGVNEAEMRRVRAQWLASNIYQRDSLFNQAREIGTYWVEGLPPDTSERLIERLAAVTPEQIQKVAQTYFGDDNLTVATLLPQSGPRAGFRKPPPGARHGGEGAR